MKDTIHHEDDELVERAKKDHREFQALYDKYFKKVYTYLWFKTSKNYEVAQDLVQETFLKALQHISQYKSRGFSYLAYLLSISRNLLTNKRRLPPPIHLEEIEAESLPDPEDTLAGIEMSQDAEGLWQTVESLSRPDKELLIMRYKDEISVEDIARRMRKSPNNIKVKLSRARKKLSKAVAQGTSGLSGEEKMDVFHKFARGVKKRFARRDGNEPLKRTYAKVLRSQSAREEKKDF